MEKNVGLTMLVVLVLLFGLVNTVVLFNRDSGVTEAQVAAIVSEAVSEIPTAAPAPEVDLSSVEDRLQGLEYELDEDERYEDFALNFSASELDSRDFRRAVWRALVAFGVSIEDWKDITSVVLIGDANASRVSNSDKVVVDYDVKVFYFLDGDESEDERARLKGFEILVTDLDHEDDFADAEVDDSYLSNLVVRRVYE